MRRVFADTFYWLAISNPSDQWYSLTQATVARIGDLRLVTTDEVLSEFLTGMSKLGRERRLDAVQTVRDILQDEDVIVLSQTHQTFLDGFALYERRLDKGDSLTDCISMNACRRKAYPKFSRTTITLRKKGSAFSLTEAVSGRRGRAFSLRP